MAVEVVFVVVAGGSVCDDDGGSGDDCRLTHDVDGCTGGDDVGNNNHSNGYDNNHNVISHFYHLHYFHYYSPIQLCYHYSR